MDETITGNHLSRTYWSLAEFASESDRQAADARNFNHRQGLEWYGGVESFDEAIDLARHGWPEQLPDALALAESAVRMADQEHMVDTFAPQWDVTGAEVDVARYLQGEPECMIDFPLTKTSKEGRVITLVASVAALNRVKPEIMIRRGHLAVALALALSQLGHAVEIWADWSGTEMASGFMTAYHRILVKGVNDELDPGQIMFALAHPAMLRALSFGIRDGFPGMWGYAFADGKGYGRSSPRKQSDEARFPAGAIFLPEITKDYSIPDVDQFLRQHLGELGLLAE